MSSTSSQLLQFTGSAYSRLFATAPLRSFLYQRFSLDFPKWVSIRWYWKAIGVESKSRKAKQIRTLTAFLPAQSGMKYLPISNGIVFLISFWALKSRACRILINAKRKLRKSKAIEVHRKTCLFRTKMCESCRRSSVWSSELEMFLKRHAKAPTAESGASVSSTRNLVSIRSCSHSTKRELSARSWNNLVDQALHYVETCTPALSRI